MGTKQAPVWYRTTGLLFTPRGHCITGRKTRVWKAIEVEGCGEGQLDKEKGRPVALKDGWVDVGSRTEGEIQAEIFASLESVQEARYSWAPKGLQEILSNMLRGQGYKDYFMEVGESRKFMTTKRRSSAVKPKPSIFISLTKTPMGSKGTLDGSMQDKDQAGPSSGYQPTISERRRPQEDLPPHEYRPKQQHRLIYHDVGLPLHEAKDITTSFHAIKDTCIGVYFLLCCVLVLTSS